MWSIEEYASYDMLSAFVDRVWTAHEYFEWWKMAVRYNSRKVISKLIRDVRLHVWWKTICEQRKTDAIKFYLNLPNNGWEIDFIHIRDIPLETCQYLLTLGVEFLPHNHYGHSERSTFFLLTIGNSHNGFDSIREWGHYLQVVPEHDLNVLVRTGTIDFRRMYCLHDNVELILEDLSPDLWGNEHVDLYSYYSPESHSIMELLYRRGMFTEEQITQLVLKILLQDPLETFQCVKSWGMHLLLSVSQVDEVFLSLMKASDKKKLQGLSEMGIHPSSDLVEMARIIVEA